MMKLYKRKGWANPGNTDAGYTLLELLVVLAILALIVGIAVPQVLKSFDRAKLDTARVQIKALSSSLEFYKFDVGRYPSEQEGLNALVVKPDRAPNWNGPYIPNEGGLVDPWGHRYTYKFPGENGLPSISVEGENAQLIASKRGAAVKNEP